MAKPEPLPVWDRKHDRLVQEYLDDHVSTYETRPRRSPTAWLESQPAYDWFIAALQNTGRSKRKIAPFIKRHNIDMSEFQPVIYRSYSEFFTRRFKPDARRFPEAPHQMGAFAEARYLAGKPSLLARSFPSRAIRWTRKQFWAHRNAPALSRVDPSSSRGYRRLTTIVCITSTTGKR
jgi:phosphatidylserine decarboxylase